MDYFRVIIGSEKVTNNYNMIKLLSLSTIEPLWTIRITLLNGYSFKNIIQMTLKFAVVGCTGCPKSSAPFKTAVMSQKIEV